LQVGKPGRGGTDETAGQSPRLAAVKTGAQQDGNARKTNYQHGDCAAGDALAQQQEGKERDENGGAVAEGNGGGQRQMPRLDFEDASPIDGAYAEQYLDYIDKKLNESMDCVIISDYGKGACTEFACQHIIRAAHDHGVPVIVDPKGAQWAKYRDVDYITPNVKEINEIMLEPIKNDDFEVEKAARYAIRKFGIRNVVLTRSSKGLSLIHNEEVVHVPTRAQEVFDVSGAGDTVIAVFGLGLAGGLKPADAAYLANLAASVVVSKLGTYAVSREELLQVLDRQEGANS